MKRGVCGCTVYALKLKREGSKRERELGFAECGTITSIVCHVGLGLTHEELGSGGDRGTGARVPITSTSTSSPPLQFIPLMN